MATPKTFFFLDRIPDIVVPDIVVPDIVVNFDRAERIYLDVEVPLENESKDYIKAESHDSRISSSGLLKPLNPQTV